LRLDNSVWQGLPKAILTSGTAFGKSPMGQGKKVNVEYVSANPTGPLHVGHTRGAVFGDALASLLYYSGYNVTREYYINDGGAQVDVLYRSVYISYL
jgi:arginyl-tRNA synthetase